MDDKFWYLKNCDLFERLKPEEISHLERHSRSKTFSRASLIYLPSDQSRSVLLLTSGRVKIYHITGDGKQALLALIDPGEMFGELALFDTGQREEFAETMEKSTVILIPVDLIEQLMERHSNVSLGVTRMMGLRRRRVERRIKSLLFRSNRQRLVDLLLELLQKYARKTDGGLLIGIRLSHQDLASMIGSTRETVTVLLGELQAEGFLTIKRRQVVVNNIDRLAASVDQLPPNLPAAAGPATSVPRQFPLGS